MTGAICSPFCSISMVFTFWRQALYRSKAVVARKFGYGRIVNSCGTFLLIYGSILAASTKEVKDD